MERNQEPTGDLASQPPQRWVRICGAILLVLVAGVVIWRVRAVVVTVLLAVVAAYVLRPAVDRFCAFGLRIGERHYRLTRGLATLLTFVLLALLIWGFWAFSSVSLEREIANLQRHWPDYQQAIIRFGANLDRYYRERLPDALRPSVDSWVRGTGDLLTRAATRGLGLTYHGVGLLIELLLVPILAFYFLADGPNIRQQALFFVPRRFLSRTEQVLGQAHDSFARYIKGQVILCVIAFAVVTAGLWAIHVDFYLLLGVAAGLTRAVPIIGPVVGAIPILIVVLITKSMALTLWVLAAFSVMHVLESKLLMPAILGQQLDLHPVLIIVALLIGAQMGGLLGVFLAAPVLAAVKSLIAEQRRSPATTG
jgi:predicted PurR-regulated permease PerM